MSQTNYKYLFGPVPSRRLGRSLGIDLIPFKVCSFDCIYCQLGRTTHKTAERREWVPTADVVAEIERWAREEGQADVVTLSGSGEPTLHTGFGEVLRAIRRLTSLPIVLLTNGSLLHLPEVRADAALADIVKVTLSAADESTWNEVHRQAAGLRFHDAVEGLKAFRAEFAGKLWLEVMLLSEVNAVEDEVRRIAALTAEIRPDRVQLNTAVRPPAESFALPLKEEEMKRLAQLFAPPAEIIGAVQAAIQPAKESVSDETILSMLQRHPCPAEDIARAFDIPLDAVHAALQRLQQARRVEPRETDCGTSYIALVSFTNP
jgi:wyosine [tRNA(Phe)-imidazoG37] synthetase (radical SAM superfamily)